MGSFEKKSSLIRVEQSTNVLLEQAVVFETVAVKSSRERYNDYIAQGNATVLNKFKITAENYIRQPNGEGEDKGMWVFPDWGLDHWDYYVNRDMTKTDRVEIFTELDLRYIPPPNPNQPDTGGFENPDGTYLKKYLRLWDLLYNQEHYLNPSLRRPRNRPFPSKPGVYKIVPDLLPDTTMPEELADRYPWAAWETAIYPDSRQDTALDETTRTRAQRFTYVRAHGRLERTRGENDLDAFNFEPHDVTNDTPLLFRAFKTAYQRQSPLGYNPVVLRDVSEYNSNGWIAFYRQEVHTTKNLVFTSSNEVWRHFIEARNVLTRKQVTPVEAVYEAMNDQVRAVYTFNALEKFDPKTWRGFTLPTYADIAKNKEVAATSAQKKTVDLLNEVLILLLRNRDGGDILELSYDANGAPVFYDQAYKIVTVQVIGDKQTVTKEGVSFDDAHIWVLSVPPRLSTTTIGELEPNAEMATTWYTDTARDLLIDQVPGVAHQATVRIIAYGEKTVFANVANLRYQFNLESARVEIRHVHYDLEKKDRFYGLGAGRWSGLRFNNAELARVSRSSPELKYVLAEHWTDVKAKKLDFFRRSTRIEKRTRAQYFDRCRQFLWVENEAEAHVFYLFVFELRVLDVYVGRFGDDVVLQVGVFKGKDVQWRNPSNYVGVRAFGPTMVATVMLPRDLGVYVAEILDEDAHFRVYFNVQLRWLSSLPQDLIQRGGTHDFDWKNSAWPELVGERVDDYDTVSPLPSLGNLGRLSWFESLRIKDETPFFKAMIRCFAKWYNVDLQNYARLFSNAVDYARICQQLVDASGGRLLVADDSMPDDVALLLPAHLNPPLLMIGLSSYDSETDNAALVYVVYDPVEMRWRNILAFSEQQSFNVHSSWGHDIDETTKRLLYDAYTHCSPAYTSGAFKQERSRLEVEVLNKKKALLAERYQRDRAIVEAVEGTLKLEATSIVEFQRDFELRMKKELREFECRVDIAVNWDTRFEDYLRDLVNFLQYFAYRCDDIAEELPVDDVRQNIINYMRGARYGIFDEKFNSLYPLINVDDYTKENVGDLLEKLSALTIEWQLPI